MESTISLSFGCDYYELSAVGRDEWLYDDGSLSITAAKADDDPLLWSVYIESSSVLGIGESPVLEVAAAQAEEDFLRDKRSLAS